MDKDSLNDLVKNKSASPCNLTKVYKKDEVNNNDQSFLLSYQIYKAQSLCMSA